MARNTMITLTRLAGAEVDSARQALQAVLAEEDRIHADMAALAGEIRREEQAVTERPEFAGHFGAFMIRARARREALEAKLHDLTPRIDAARDALAAAFANQKKYEIAKKHREAAAAAEEKRRDGIDLDEIGLTTHRRKTGGK